ncbi:MAG: hypothetical protein ABIW81_01265 [Terrimesophilobacter sp.]
MPRSNRPRRGRHAPVGAHAGAQGSTEGPALDLNRALFGTLRTETKRGLEWNVQPISATSALKPYRCPGCNLEIPLGQPHLVAWRADGLLGKEADIASRRHWHSHCWKVN